MTQNTSVPGDPKHGQIRILAVASGLFAVWGLALWLYNSLFFKFSHFFALGPGTTAITLAAFHTAYALLALPAVLFHRQFGYKLGFLTGLSVFGVGAFLLYLSLIEHQSGYLLAAVMVIGICGAWLDTSLNPLAAMAGSAKTTVQRINLAHTCNAAGLFVAYAIGVTVLGQDYQLTSGVTAQLTARPYVLVGLGAILLAFLVEQITLPAAATKGAERGQSQIAQLGQDLRVLFHDRRFLNAALTLAAYCAVLTILWTANYRYQHQELPGRIIPLLERGWFWFVTGRLSGVILMRWIAPARLLAISTAACLAAIVLTLTGGLIGWIALLSASFFLAITYPTVFGTALGHHSMRLAAAAGVLVVATGLGNAVSSLFSSAAMEAFDVNSRFVVLAAAPLQAAITVYAWAALRTGRAKA